MEGIEGNMDVYPSKTERKNEEPLFSPLSSFLSFRFSSSIAPSRRFHLSLMSHVTNSTAPLRVLLGSSSFLISGEVLISDFRFALPFFTTLYTHTCIFVWMRVCALDYPPPFDIHTQHIYIYFLISLWPWRPPPRPCRALSFSFFNFWREKKIIT